MLQDMRQALIRKPDRVAETILQSFHLRIPSSLSIVNYPFSIWRRKPPATRFELSIDSQHTELQCVVTFQNVQKFDIFFQPFFVEKFTHGNSKIEPLKRAIRPPKRLSTHS
jgi:hypothetical protein